MKKILFLFILLFTNILKADFLENMKNIDLLLQKGRYQEALDNGMNLLKTDITDSEKEALTSLLEDIKIKVDALTNTTISNNTGVIYTTEEGLTASSIGTIVLAGDQVNDKKYFDNLSNLEKETLKSKNEENINKLMQIYIKSSLFEKAMKLGLNSKDIRNIYMAALSARIIGKYDISISLYNKLLNLDSNNLEALLGIGLAYRGKQEYKVAVKFLRQYLDNGGTNPNVSKIIDSLNNK